MTSQTRSSKSKLKIYWASNSPMVGSGYGQQTDLFTRAAVQAGHQVTIRCIFGHHGTRIHDPYHRLLLPASNLNSGDDIIALDWKHYQPDVSVVLYDAWTYSDHTMQSAPLTMYAPVDHTTVPPDVLKRLRRAKFVWAMSKHGERAMRKAGLDPFYVPHAVDTDVFKPMTEYGRAEMRRMLDVPDDAFLVVSVAANKGFPDRKNLRGLFKAWSRFIVDHPHAVLYLHSRISSTHGGLDLVHLRDFYGIPDANIIFANEYKLINGEYKPELLNLWYNAADAFILASRGEGFGVPALEAQAGGCPVILTDATAQTELCGSGWLIEVDELDDLEYNNQGAEWARVRPSEIIRALRLAYEMRGVVVPRIKARQFAMAYDYRVVWSKWALPALEAAAEMASARGWPQYVDSGRQLAHAGD